MKARSHNEMKKTLNWWDLIWFGLGVVIGVGIFVLTGLEAKNHPIPVLVMSYVVSGEVGVGWDGGFGLQGRGRKMGLFFIFYF